MKLTDEQEQKLITAIDAAIRQNSSPTIGRGAMHKGEQGYIIYEKSGMPNVIADILIAIEQTP